MFNIFASARGFSGEPIYWHFRHQYADLDLSVFPLRCPLSNRHAGFVPNLGSVGTFQEYVRAPASTTCPIPASIPFETASVLPLGVSTAAAALYQKDKLALPYPAIDSASQNGVVLIWGGSASVGSCAIQLARASGFQVYSTASPHNFASLRQLGATEVFDRSSPTVADDIRAVLARNGNKLVAIMDSISQPDTIRLCRQIASAAELAMVIGTVTGMEGWEDGVEYKSVWAPDTQVNEVGPAVFAGFLGQALEKGLFYCKPDPQVAGKGLGEIQKAMGVLKRGVSAKKIVVSL